VFFCMKIGLLCLLILFGAGTDAKRDIGLLEQLKGGLTDDVGIVTKWAVWRRGMSEQKSKTSNGVLASEVNADGVCQIRDGLASGHDGDLPFEWLGL
jgi:hypothetical protein